MGVKGNFDFKKSEENPEDAILRKQKLSTAALSSAVEEDSQDNSQAQ